MIKFLKTLRTCYRDKDIYLWGVDHYAITVLGMLAVQKIKVKGIITEKGQYIGQTYWNVPIVHVEEVKKEKSIIVTAGNCRQCHLSDDIIIVSYSELFSMNDDLNKGVIIYGAGEGGRQKYDEFIKCGVDVAAFCVTNKGTKIEKYMNRPVILVDEICDPNSHPIVVAALNVQYKKEMMEHIRERGWDVYLDIDEIVSFGSMGNSFFIQGIQKALTEQKKIYLYTKKDLIYDLLEDVFKIYGIEISDIIWEESDGEDRKNIWDLAYEDISGIFVIINEIDTIELQTSCELLEQIGFSLGDLNYVGIRKVAPEYKNRIVRKYDILTGNSIVADNKIPGCTVHGAVGKENIRIIILGGSTSTDAYFRVESWPSLLHKQLVQNGISAIIYNFAHSAEDVVQEILRLLRDGWYIHPDYVVSMSGVNNFAHKQPQLKNEFVLNHLINIEQALYTPEQCVHGIQGDENPYEFWLRMEKIEAAICGVYGAKFLSYLQPQKIGMSDMSLLEESMYTFEGADGSEGRDFRDNATDDEIYSNLLSLFDNDRDMFFDQCHYTLKANRRLADIVFQDIKSSMHKK